MVPVNDFAVSSGSIELIGLHGLKELPTKTVSWIFSHDICGYAYKMRVFYGERQLDEN